MKFVTEQKKRRRSEVAIEFENKAQFTWMCRWRNTPCDISPLCQKSHQWNNTWIVTYPLNPLPCPPVLIIPASRIRHLAEVNDLWSSGQCQFLTFQCQCLNEFDGPFPIGQSRALIWTGLVKIFLPCQIVRRLVRDGEDIWAANINFKNLTVKVYINYRADAEDEGDWVAVKPRLTICEENFIDCKDSRNRCALIRCVNMMVGHLKLSWYR